MEKEEGKKAMIFCCRKSWLHQPPLANYRHYLPLSMKKKTEKKKKWPFWLFSWQGFRVMGEIQPKNCVFLYFFSYFMERMRCCKIGVP
jgi:hypothetical protein